MNSLTRAERLNYDGSGSDTLLDLSKYGFMDVNLYQILEGKNQYLLKQEYGKKYIYLQIEQAYSVIKSLPSYFPVNFNKFQIDKIKHVEYKNPYNLIFGYMMSNSKRFKDVFKVANELSSDEIIIDAYDILIYSKMWDNIKMIK